ncbi:MAG: hypothetical protein R3349_02020 [Geminicoccaceae bacterium]|nr:hypothetical protein [Geminicoccaceae bacterium]
MPLSDPDLWARLEAMAIGPDEAALPFVDRLARDHGWIRAFAGRVIEEYRRFLYLTRVVGQPVTPSDQVDQVWHLHLTYTRSYWDDLCQGVLGRPLHHSPTNGGPDERRRFDAQYRATLEAYQREFGEAPPADIWPDPAVRFGKHYVRVDRDAVWTIDKRLCDMGVRHGLAVFLCLGLGACAQIVDDLITMTFFEQALLTVFVGLTLLCITRWALATPDLRARRKDRASGCGSGCSDCGCGGGCD